MKKNFKSAAAALLKDTEVRTQIFTASELVLAPNPRHAHLYGKEYDEYNIENYDPKGIESLRISFQEPYEQGKVMNHQNIVVYIDKDGNPIVEMGNSRTITAMTHYPDGKLLATIVDEPLTDDEKIAENLVRTDQSYLSIAAAIAIAKKKGKNIRQIASTIGKSVNEAKDLLGLSKLSHRAKKLSTTLLKDVKIAIALSKYDKAKQNEILDYIESNDINYIKSKAMLNRIARISEPTLDQWSVEHIEKHGWDISTCEHIEVKTEGMLTTYYVLNEEGYNAWREEQKAKVLAKVREEFSAFIKEPSKKYFESYRSEEDLQQYWLSNLINREKYIFLKDSETHPNMIVLINEHMNFPDVQKIVDKKYFQTIEQKKERLEQSIENKKAKITRATKEYAMKQWLSENTSNQLFIKYCVLQALGLERKIYAGKSFAEWAKPKGLLKEDGKSIDYVHIASIDDIYRGVLEYITFNDSNRHNLVKGEGKDTEAFLKITDANRYEELVHEAHSKGEYAEKIAIRERKGREQVDKQKSMTERIIDFVHSGVYEIVDLKGMQVPFLHLIDNPKEISNLPEKMQREVLKRFKDALSIKFAKGTTPEMAMSKIITSYKFFAKMYADKDTPAMEFNRKDAQEKLEHWDAAYTRMVEKMEITDQIKVLEKSRGSENYYRTTQHLLTPDGDGRQPSALLDINVFVNKYWVGLELPKNCIAYLLVNAKERN